jgi:UDP-N-acetylglucosamine acyltransferase
MIEQHPTAIISKKAEIGENVKVGPFSIIEDDAIIGDNCQIDSGVVVYSGVRLGKNIKISHGAAIGGPPQDLKYAGEKTELHIGDNTVIREFAALNRGTVAHGKSEIGKNCLIMAYAHVAHDCLVGDNAILVNSVQMGGHVEIGDWAILGGCSLIHQFCHVGEHAMVGAGFKVAQDILPYSLNAGYPLRCMGLNLIGLRRRGFSNETINTLKLLFRYLMSSKLNTSQALAIIDKEIEKTPEVLRVLDFIKKSKRGVIK